MNRAEHIDKIEPTFQSGFTAIARALHGCQGSGARPLRLLAVLGLAIFVLGVSASTVLGAERHSYSSSFGAPGSEAGQLALVTSYDSGDSGIAINEATHDLYVADTNNNRIDEFSAAGEFIRAWGWGVADGKKEFETCTLTCQAGIPGNEPGQLNAPKFIAVDNAAGPSPGAVYVASEPYGQIAVAINKFTPTGELAHTWGTDGQLDGSTTPGGSFGTEFYGIAISASGDLILLELPQGTSNLRLVALTQSGSFQEEREFPVGATHSYEQLAKMGFAIDNSSGPSSGDIYGISAARGAFTAKFSFAGQFLGEPDIEEGRGVAVDSSNGDLYVAHATNVADYDSIGNLLGKFGSSEAAEGELREPTGGLAVDPSNHTVFLADAGSQRIDVFISTTTPALTLAPATNVEREAASVSGTLNPGGTTPDAEIKECQFEYVEDSVLQAHKATLSTNEIFTTYGSSSTCLNPDGSMTAPLAPDTAEHAVHADLAGLHSGTTYDLRLLARNVNLTESTLPSSFTTLAQFVPPTVESPYASEVSSSSAVLEDEVNPNRYQTDYRFEYVDNATYEADLLSGDGFQHASRVPAADAVLGATATAQRVRQLVVGLAPATAYRYRLVADNGHGEALSSVQGFVTQSALVAPVLLDGRVWEMVSPPQKSGSTIVGIQHELAQGVLQASADGDGLAYVANESFGQEAPGNRSLLDSQFLAFRGANGWSSKDITTPREDVVGVFLGDTAGYEEFSQDLSLGALQPRGVTPLSSLATETTPYLRATNGEFLPLVDSLDVPPETVFDGKRGRGGLIETYYEEPQFEGGSPDLHSVVIGSCYRLTEDAVNLCGKALANLYVWHEGALQLASVLPNGQPAVGGSELGSHDLKRHAVSEDGTRLVFSSGNDLYLRDMTLPGAVQLDLPEPGAAGGSGTLQFEDMSADGSKVFFTDTTRLTTDSNADNSHPDLYMCEIVVEGEALSCVLTDLTVARNTGEAGAVLGASIGADASGRYVYFVANGALTPDAAPGDCLTENGGSGTCGLYLYDTVTGTIKLVTTLSGADYRDWSAELGEMTARVSPNGRFLAFMSQRSLTGYDNRDAVSGQADQEVYLYDRLGDGGEGKLVCASCDPTGARPHGVEIAKNAHSLLNEEGVWSAGTWLAAAIPGWTPYDPGPVAFYQSRYLSDSGRLFFNSVDALVPRDSNGTLDVYEYEPPQGEGQPASNDCSVSSPNYSSSSGGCVDLVSSGVSAEESVFLDASESGDDVFFLTSSQLVPADVDTADDIYDARVGGVVSEVVKLPACEGDACQSPVSAPEDPTPDSLTFQGPGNPLPLVAASVKAKPATRAQKLARALKVCAGKPKRKRAACERQARRSYGPVGKAKKANRRAHR